MSQNTYTCSACSGVFEKGWSDDEAMDESRTLWGNLKPEEIAVICDDCHQAMMAHLKQREGHA